MQSLLLPLLILLQAPIPAPDPKPAVVARVALDGPAQVMAGSSIVVDAGLSVSDRPLKWKLLGTTETPIVATDAGSQVKNTLALVKSARVGTYQFAVVATGTDGESDFGIHTVVVTAGPSPPPTPVPPGPTPQPPPDPNPPVPPAPGPSKEFRALVMYESQDAADRATLNVLNSTKLADWLNANCTKSASGQPGWRRWDKDIVFPAKGGEDMKALWDSVKPSVKSYPCLVTFRDGTAEIFPLPATVDEAISLLQRQKGGR